MSFLNGVPGPPIQNFIALAKVGLPPLTSPGLAVVKNAGSPRNWKVMEGYGSDGASLVYAGAGLSPFDVDIFLNFGNAAARAAQWLEWELFTMLLAKPPALPFGIGLPDFSLSIAHPILNAKPWNIQRVVVDDVTSWEQDDKGLWSLTIKFKEYRKPKSALQKPLESPPDIADGAIAPVDPAEAQIAELQAKNAALDAALP